MPIYVIFQCQPIDLGPFHNNPKISLVMVISLVSYQSFIQEIFIVYFALYLIENCVYKSALVILHNRVIMIEYHLPHGNM